MDSEASCSIAGADVIKVIKAFGLNQVPSHYNYVTTADGKQQNVKGSVDLSLCTNGECKLVRVLIVPSLKDSFYFGSDFCRIFGVIIDFKKNCWDIKNALNNRFEIAELSSSLKIFRVKMCLPKLSV